MVVFDYHSESKCDLGNALCIAAAKSLPDVLGDSVDGTGPTGVVV